jgi:DnaJ-class molecular chaperone
VKIEPGTKPEAQIRISDIVPHEDGKNGDVVVTIDMDFPEKPILKKKPIWQRLNIKWAQCKNPKDIDDIASEAFSWNMFEEH